MVKLILKPLTDSDQDVVIEKGKTVLGRGTLLNVSVVGSFCFVKFFRSWKALQSSRTLSLTTNFPIQCSDKKVSRSAATLELKEDGEVSSENAICQLVPSDRPAAGDSPTNANAGSSTGCPHLHSRESG